MLKVQVTSQIELDVDELLKGMAQLDADELEQLIERIAALRAQRLAPSLTPDESRLLQSINQGVPVEVRRRSAELNARLHDETITPEEQRELLALVDQIELADAERMRNLIALAQARGVTVDALIEQLGIRGPLAA